MFVLICSSYFLMVIFLMFLTPCFLQTKANFPTSENPFESLSWGYALHLVVWKFFIFRMLSVCLRFSTSASKFLFRVYPTFWGVAIVAITLSIEKEDNLARQTSSKASMTMNLRKSFASFSVSDTDRFLLSFW